MDFIYEIKYSNRKTINISVERDRSVIVRAPQGVSEEKIDFIVKSKKDWILEKINHKQKYPVKPEPKEFVSGETILYQGKNYQLTVVADKFIGVQFNQRFKISREYQEEAYKFFRDWFYERAIEQIIPRVQYYAHNLGVNYNQVKISDMKYRWGSCTPNNNVIFNWRLIKAPMYVLEYIIVHELAHLIEPNHTPEFWNIVSIQIPQYDKAKKWLKQNGYLLEVDF